MIAYEIEGLTMDERGEIYVPPQELESFECARTAEEEYYEEIREHEFRDAIVHGCQNDPLRDIQLRFFVSDSKGLKKPIEMVLDEKTGRERPRQIFRRKREVNLVSFKGSKKFVQVKDGGGKFDEIAENAFGYKVRNAEQVLMAKLKRRDQLEKELGIKLT